MRLLVTGASGFLGSHLVSCLLKAGHEIIPLVHQRPLRTTGLRPVVGDVTLTGLGITDAMPLVDSVVNCAGVVSFGRRNQNQLYRSNYLGVVNLATWCEQRAVPLYHISTAYICDGLTGSVGADYLPEQPQFRNYYEESKAKAERHLRSTDLEWTIIRPSILVGDSQVSGVPPLMGVYSVVRAVYLAKQWLERAVALPPLHPTLRLQAVPEATLNIIPVDIAAQMVAEIISDEARGSFHVVNEHPPTIAQFAEAGSRAIGARVYPEEDFVPNPAEMLVHRLTRNILPYMRGEPAFDVAASHKHWSRCKGVSLEFVEQTVGHFLLNHQGSR